MSADSQQELFTVVGSCVAVTLYDSKNHIGGLVHIVLPGRRVSRREGDRNAYYADTGVPLLVEEMVKAGAQKKYLVANVIGGSSQHTNYEENTIGRRNADVAIAMLKKEDVSIKNENVGGSSGCRIILGVATGKVDVQRSSAHPVKPAVEHEGVFSENEISRLLRQIERLKPDSNTAGRLLDAVHDPGSSIQKIQDTISEDFVLAFHIFRMCNSAYYGHPHRISSFPDALRLIGERQFKLICVLVGSMRQQENSSVDFGLSSEKISKHSHATALIARCLALRASRDLSAEAYAAGLLHSIGKLGTALLISTNGQNDFSEIDPDVFDKNSGKIAEIILTKWNIPDKIVKAAIDFDNPPAGSSDHPMLTAIIHVACELSHLLGISIEEKICIVNISRNALSQIGLPDGPEPILPDILKALNSAGLIDRIEIQPLWTKRSILI